MNEQQILQDLDNALTDGRLNDALRLASEHTPFWIENVLFLRILGASLSTLGFVEEGRSVSAFADRLEEHRQTHADVSHRDVEAAAARGHSEPYRREGTTTQWEHPVWELRARMVAEMIPPGATVLDLGCGNMLLERHLPEGCRYVPCDVAPRDERTLVCDFDRGEYPGGQGETVVLCLGVMPYLRRQADLLRHILGRGKPCLVSFKPRELIQTKIEAGVFPPAISLDEVVAMVEEAGFDGTVRYLMGQGDEMLLAAEPKRS